MQPWQDPELEEIRKAHAEFAKKELEGDASARDRDGDFSRQRWKTAADFGVLGICMPEDCGGQGRPVTHAVAAFEGLGQGCRDSGFLYAMCSQLFGIQMAINLLAPKALKGRYLPKLIAGDSMSAHGFTEESSGSDAFSMESFAEKKDGGYVLNGRKCFITNAPSSDIALVFARTKEGRNPFGLVALLVEMDQDGARHGREFEKVGLRTTHMGELIFENVFVPAENLISGSSGGLRVLMESTGWERAVLMAHALGPMARGLEACIERSRTREQFGKPIGSFQQVSSRIADMTVTYRVCRQLVYDIASKLGTGTSIMPHLQDAAVTKLFVSESFVRFEQNVLQILGVRGYLLDSFAQQDLRDSLSYTIWAGTSETLRNTIAKFAGVPVE